jgi:hypothetical protein
MTDVDHIAIRNNCTGAYIAAGTRTFAWRLSTSRRCRAQMGTDKRPSSSAWTLIRYAKEDPGVPRTRETVERTLFAVQGGRIEEVYRVQLPCNPIIGEGKPENQNHAIIFTRGEALQATNPRARAKTHALTHTAAYTTEFR